MMSCLLTVSFNLCYTLLVPKKTKQEKIIAELRRKLEATNTTVKPVISDIGVKIEKHQAPQPITPTTNYQIPAVKNPIGKATIQPNQSNVYIIKDLRKTFLLTTLAISFEFVIYWLTELGGSKFFRF